MLLSIHFYDFVCFNFSLVLGSRQCLTTFPNTEKRVENMTHSGVFLMNFKVFGNLKLKRKRKKQNLIKETITCFNIIMSSSFANELFNG